jgi:large subunit ribosomal protein L3
MNGLIGRKLGMTRVFAEDGTVTPVTVIEAGPCPVIQVKENPRGDKVAQLGFGEKKAKRTAKALAGHVKAAGVEAAPRILRDFDIPEGADAPTLGDFVKADVFAEGDIVKVTGTTRGRGFQGVVKRYGFKGAPASHGHSRTRSRGSMGPGTDPSRVIKGMKLPGQMGNKQQTETGLSIVRVDVEKNLIFVKGAVPGPKTGLLLIKKQEGKSRYV